MQAFFLLDLNGNSVAFAVSRGSHDGAYRLRDPALLSDDLSHIVRICGKHKDYRPVFAFADVYRDALGLVHDGARYISEHFLICFHCSFRFSDAEKIRVRAVGTADGIIRHLEMTPLFTSRALTVSVG